MRLETLVRLIDEARPFTDGLIPEHMVLDEGRGITGESVHLEAYVLAQALNEGTITPEDTRSWYEQLKPEAREFLERVPVPDELLILEDKSIKVPIVSRESFQKKLSFETTKFALLEFIHGRTTLRPIPWLRSLAETGEASEDVALGMNALGVLMERYIVAELQRKQDVSRRYIN